MMMESLAARQRKQPLMPSEPSHLHQSFKIYIQTALISIITASIAVFIFASVFNTRNGPLDPEEDERLRLNMFWTDLTSHTCTTYRAFALVRRADQGARWKHKWSRPVPWFVSFFAFICDSTTPPLYVVPHSTFSYAIRKLLATNAHRLFVTDSDFEPSSSPGSPMGGGLCGIVSVVDSAYFVHRISCSSTMPNLYDVVLSLFAPIAYVSNVDPTQRMRHRCASSTSSLLVSEHCAGLVTLWVTRANTGSVAIQQRFRALKIQ
ncbi:hypothetical protein DFJ58DRAFT_893275 [Suillus subalutaceus]|uniref:uncharacterized protein n=1 Tax=Suillus subalutaceus TaxID=48586 RepID=UPI001B866910|nr:uncharacterized protein DFJ58DRAFT_893275 [Suillus subalutaceus]KAG1846108.1 hypothetical protein DFJ58DRAFT_893275 [Suillus subalutaceus]